MLLLRIGNASNWDVQEGQGRNALLVSNDLKAREGQGLSLFEISSSEAAIHLGYIFAIVHRKKGPVNQFGFLIPSELVLSLGLTLDPKEYEEDPPELRIAHREIPGEELTDELRIKLAANLIASDPVTINWYEEQILQKAVELAKNPEIGARLSKKWRRAIDAADRQSRKDEG